MTAIRCEGCGYSLEGLEFDAICPECARPVAQSRPGRRSGSPWQRHPSVSTFFVGSAEMLTHPQEFWDDVQVEIPRSWNLLVTNLVVASAIMGGTATAHPIGAILLGAPVFVIIFLLTLLMGAFVRLLTPGASVGAARAAVAHASSLWMAAALLIGAGIMLRLWLPILLALAPAAAMVVVSRFGARRLRFVTPIA